ncbi:MAG: hypothetical protein NC311_13210 [Muribaculaceae bacterium]|nr:hypothetical protein [Muribaculaceae bacterium]
MTFGNNQFYNNIFNQQYVSQSSYIQRQNEIARYQANQNNEVTKAVKAMHDLCEATKNMDAEHQQQAMLLCLAEAAREFGW